MRRFILAPAAEYDISRFWFGRTSISGKPQDFDTKLCWFRPCSTFQTIPTARAAVPALKWLALSERITFITADAACLPKLDASNDQRHFLTYRYREGGEVEIVRVLHDSVDLDRHIPEIYGFQSEPESEGEPDQ